MALDPSLEGSVWFIIIITVLATIGITIIKVIVSKFVEFFMIKKRENEDEIRTEISKFSTILFVLLAGFLLFWQRDKIASFLDRSSNEVLFVSFMLFVLVIFAVGVIYREPSKDLRRKISRKKAKN